MFKVIQTQFQSDDISSKVLQKTGVFTVIDFSGEKYKKLHKANI